MIFKSGAQTRRQQLKAEFWPNETAWTGDSEKGWFRAPRTLPLILIMLSSKSVSGKIDPTSVYLELLARHRDGGVVEMVSEGEHSYCAGYPGPRGTRTWQERMNLLETLGFIKVKRGGNQHYKLVMLVHPTLAAAKHKHKMPAEWWDLYRQIQIESKEAPYEEVLKRAEKEGTKPTKGKTGKSEK